MPVYDRTAATDYRVIDRWDDGLGWLAHPDEAGRRASHAARASDGDGVWVFDPLDAPGVDGLVADLGPVRGVVVCADYHARDAGALARRHDVSVHVHRSLDRIADRVDAPLERFDGALGAFEVLPLRPMGLWRETALYRTDDGTLYVPDYLSSHSKFTTGEERIGMPTFARLAPAYGAFSGLAPDRVLFGHGEGVFEDAEAALGDTMANARARFPRALVTNLPGELRAIAGAVG